MAIIPFEPFRSLDNFFEDDFFPVIPSRWQKFPRINLENKEKEIVAEAEIPGFSPEDIKVTIENNVLEIEGKSEDKKEEKKKNYYHQEFSSGYFQRSINLPAKVKEGDAQANYEDGLLKIVIPKEEESQSRKIDVQVSKKKS
ncbi:Hsp20/alpha crystallin family protein [Patescibacteria group bacterium]|nr:Hsp20/alpha crystallin family protein [Patescibacteria group bacterium]